MRILIVIGAIIFNTLALDTTDLNCQQIACLSLSARFKSSDTTLDNNIVLRHVLGANTCLGKLANVLYNVWRVDRVKLLATR